ncbi:MAG: FkbM family methyltransferase [Chthoniobacter sp.]
MRIYPEKRGMGAPGLFYLFRGGFESLIPFCVHHFVQPGDSCFDIGANVGMWSLLMSERCGNGGRVYSFEPLGRNARCLRQNIELSHKDNIAVVETALGRETGKVRIFTPDDPGRTSLAPESANDQMEEVPLKRLDDVWADWHRPAIAFVKMDVEGSEPFVLAGGEQFFGECKPIVVSEINPAKLASLGNQADDVFQFFRRLNYAAFQFNDPAGKLEQIERCADGDVVFVPEGHAALNSVPVFKS